MKVGEIRVLNGIPGRICLLRLESIDQYGAHFKYIYDSAGTATKEICVSSNFERHPIAELSLLERIIYGIE